MSRALYVPVTNRLHGLRVTRAYLLSVGITYREHMFGSGEPLGFAQQYPTMMLTHSGETKKWPLERRVFEFARECVAHMYLRRQYYKKR